LTIGNKACRHLDLFTIVRFSLNSKTCCLYVVWEKQDKIWANIFCIPKIMHSRTPMDVRYTKIHKFINRTRQVQTIAVNIFFVKKNRK